jgi:hypothetical protein
MAAQELTSLSHGARGRELLAGIPGLTETSGTRFRRLAQRIDAITAASTHRSKPVADLRDKEPVRDKEPGMDAADAKKRRKHGRYARARMTEGRQLKTALTGIALVFLMAGPVSGQWLKIRLPGTPRTSDGTPDLTAPAPRTPDGGPDLSGIWQRPRGATPGTAGSTPNDGIASGVEVLFQPWAEALYKDRAENNGKGTPSERCLPHGITKAVSVPEPFKIVQTPGLIVILHEEFNHYRQIFTDGRRVPENRNPTWLGHSRGKWEGDTLVVDTVGFVDETWLDFRGHPATDALHIVERIRRRDFGHLEVQFTIDDSKAYVKPWTVTMMFDLLPDTELIEHICENETDAAHLVGK